ncbi:MAG: type I-E CRISPR-associated protein Cas5/CasD [Gammaproteobacteria bacterium]|nr:type I-E CRISPR-associated protein Cas5/CasD [Gammaproteobacteria bacterium]
MRMFLLFRLYGPLASWGEVAVGEQRLSAGYPSKSAILGLLGAALGIKREQEEVHRTLSSAYRVGIRVDNAGELLRDYHTAQVPPERRNVKYYTRRDELKNDDLYTILSSRDYRTDGCYAVAIWIAGDDAPYSLDELAASLKNPKYVPYLGRKSCPVALPLTPLLVNAVSLKAAFDQSTWQKEDFLVPLPTGTQISYYWEELGNEEAGMPASMVYARRDQALSRRRWQFAERNEFYFSEAREEEAL